MVLADPANCAGHVAHIKEAFAASLEEVCAKQGEEDAGRMPLLHMQCPCAEGGAPHCVYHFVQPNPWY